MIKAYRTGIESNIKKGNTTEFRSNTKSLQPQIDKNKTKIHSNTKETHTIILGSNTKSLRPLIKDFKTGMQNNTNETHTKKTMCTPKNNIVFLKTRKAGGTTLQNIFCRYGERNNLTFVLPHEGWVFRYPKAFQKEFAISPPPSGYNIFCHEAVFNNDVITDMMPNNTVFITILREPVAHYESTFTYFGTRNKCGIRSISANSLDEFFSSPSECYKKTPKNHLLLNLGATYMSFDDDRAIEMTIAHLEDKFDLVMIMEHFEESLILLKDLLCWTTNDITYFELNRRETQSVHKLSDSLTNRIREWNKGDVALYQHFKQIFWKKVRNFGEKKMKTEIENLRDKNLVVRQRCLQEDGSVNGGKSLNVYEPPGIKMNQMHLRPEATDDADCQRRIYPPRVYTPILRNALLNKKA
uniref:Galactosylceramide sulfotransferase-like n=1 Tax=Saccoglossus kowalevskii TaxID=10224 RepID=A0ABM0MJS9_SACKO|nr:PREDICTED: galactosylceramide sulfotransferase-like [Saccoglossus kowalevskii]